MNPQSTSLESKQCRNCGQNYENPNKAVLQLLDDLLNCKEAGPFSEPVAWEEAGLLDYPIIITQPCDLGTIRVCIFMWP